MEVAFPLRGTMLRRLVPWFGILLAIVLALIVLRLLEAAGSSARGASRTL